MDPNSSHQLWSKWTLVIRPPDGPRPAFALVELQAARMLRAQFGSAGQARVRVFRNGWIIEALVDAQRHPHDEREYQAISRRLALWVYAMFGVGSGVTIRARLMAGARLDGQSPDQMLVLPRLAWPVPQPPGVM